MSKFNKLIKNTFILAIVSMFLFQACDKKLQEGTLEEGMSYKFITKTEGEKAKDGDILEFNAIYTDDKDSVLHSSIEQGMPIFAKKDSLWGSMKTFEDCLNLMSEGDSAIFTVPAKAIFKNRMPPNVNTASFITVNVGMIGFMTEQEARKKMNENQTSMRMKQIDEMRKLAIENGQELITSEGAEIDEYLAANNLKAKTTASGIRYVITKPGTGDNPKPGDSVKVNYTGYLLNGKVFDSSKEDVAKEHGLYNERRPYAPIEFQLGVGNVILGWDEGIGLLNKGAEGKIYIPSPLAYGARAKGDDIPANAILVFDIELVDINGK